MSGFYMVTRLDLFKNLRKYLLCIKQSSLVGKSDLVQILNGKKKMGAKPFENQTIFPGFEWSLS
jgi:hypothetical protein